MKQSMDARYFIESSKLQLLVPQATAIDIDTVLTRSSEVSGSNGAFGVEQRSLLYFGPSSATGKCVMWSYSSLGME